MKSDELFKLVVVKDYLSGVAGSKGLAQKYGNDHGAMRNWVAAYEARGESGSVVGLPHPVHRVLGFFVLGCAPNADLQQTGNLRLTAPRRGRQLEPGEVTARPAPKCLTAAKR